MASIKDEPVTERSDLSIEEEPVTESFFENTTADLFDRKPIQRGESFVCPYCPNNDTEFDNRADCAAHIRKHDNKPYFCKPCDEGFDTSNELWNHQSTCMPRPVFHTPQIQDHESEMELAGYLDPIVELNPSNRKHFDLIICIIRYSGPRSYTDGDEHRSKEMIAEFTRIFVDPAGRKPLTEYILFTEHSSRSPLIVYPSSQGVPNVGNLRIHELMNNVTSSPGQTAPCVAFLTCGLDGFTTNVNTLRYMIQTWGNYHLYFAVVLAAGCTAPQYEDVRRNFPRLGYSRWGLMPFADLSGALRDETNCNQSWRSLLAIWDFLDTGKINSIARQQQGQIQTGSDVDNEEDSEEEVN